MPIISLPYNIRQLFCSIYLLLFIYISLTLPVHAQEKDNTNIVVVLSKDTGPYLKFYQQLKITLLSNGPQNIKIFVVSSNIIKSISELYRSAIKPDFIVTAGIHAARTLITSEASTPVIFSLLPGSSYQNDIRNSHYCQTQNRCSAVYLEQPLDRQLSIIKKGLPDIRNLGVILGPASAAMRDSLLHAGKKYGININIALAKKDDNVVILADYLNKIDEALLALPDPYVYNRRTAKGILISSYEHQVPLIGYSHGFVHAGALFSIYSSLRQIASQTGMMLIEALLSPQNKLPSPEYPDAYMVEANPAVMHYLRSNINFNKSILGTR